MFYRDTVAAAVCVCVCVCVCVARCEHVVERPADFRRADTVFHKSISTFKTAVNVFFGVACHFRLFQIFSELFGNSETNISAKALHTLTDLVYCIALLYRCQILLMFSIKGKE